MIGVMYLLSTSRWVDYLKQETIMVVPPYRVEMVIGPVVKMLPRDRGL